MNLLVHFVIYGHGNFQNITDAHKSQNTLLFIQFPIHICFIFITKYILLAECKVRTESYGTRMKRVCHE